MNKTAETVIKRITELENMSKEKKQRNKALFQNAVNRIAELDALMLTETDPATYEKYVQEKMQCESTRNAMQNAVKAPKKPVISKEEYKSMHKSLEKELITLQDSYAPKLEEALDAALAVMYEYISQADELDAADRKLISLSNAGIVCSNSMQVYKIDEHTANKDNWVTAFCRAYYNNIADMQSKRR